MTVLMTILQQMPNATAAATIVRAKDARHILTHHSSGSQESDSYAEHGDNDGDDDADAGVDADVDSENSSSISRSSGSRSIEDIFKIFMKNGGPHDSRRTRKIKRHSDDFYLLHHQHKSATDLEWSNPCSGVFEPSKEANSMKPPPSFYLTKLRRVLGSEFHTINDTMNAIDISDMATWSKYRRYFSFLPKISLDSNIALKRWYRHMQTYVATFAYLGRTHYKWDHAKHMSTSATTRELNDLLNSARGILCEIETTINGSYPFPSNQPKLTAISREAMNKKLHFLTKRHLNADQPDVAIEPQMLDLQFAKSKYFHYLRRMWRVIRMKTKRNGQKQVSLGLSADSSASVSVADTIEDLIGADLNDLSRNHSSSSASESLEYSMENKSRLNRHSRQHKRQQKTSQKSGDSSRSLELKN